MELLLYSILTAAAVIIISLHLAYLVASVYLRFKPSKTAASIQLFVILTAQKFLPYFRS